MCSTVQEQITTCGQNAIVKIGERTNIRPQKSKYVGKINAFVNRFSASTAPDFKQKQYLHRILLWNAIGHLSHEYKAWVTL